MNHEEKKEKVLEILKEKEKSTSEISSLISRDFYFTQRLLEEMEKQNLIIKISLGNFTYWRLAELNEI